MIGVMSESKMQIFQRIWQLVQTIIIVIVIPWSIWVTNNIYVGKSFIETGPRFTEKDAILLEYKIYQNIAERYPPKQLLNDVSQMKKDIEEIKITLAKNN